MELVTKLLSVQLIRKFTVRDFEFVEPYLVFTTYGYTAQKFIVYIASVYLKNALAKLTHIKVFITSWVKRLDRNVKLLGWNESLLHFSIDVF